MSSSDEAYKQVLKNRIQEINIRINALNQKKYNAFNEENIEVSIRGLEKEKEYLNEKLNSYVDYNQRRRLDYVTEGYLEKVDELAHKKDVKIEELQEAVDNLKKLKDKLILRREKQKIDKKIAKKQEQIMKLQKRKITFNKIGYAIMYPKYRKDLAKINILSKQEEKVNFYNDKLHDINEKRNALGNSVLDNIKEVGYGIQEWSLRRKSAHSIEVLKEMKSHESTILMRGAEVIHLNKKIVNKLKNTIDGLSNVNDNSLNPRTV